MGRSASALKETAAGLRALSTAATKEFAACSTQVAAVSDVAASAREVSAKISAATAWILAPVRALADMAQGGSLRYPTSASTRCNPDLVGGR